jgi:hypothetical protein
MIYSSAHGLCGYVKAGQTFSAILAASFAFGNVVLMVS